MKKTQRRGILSMVPSYEKRKEKRLGEKLMKKKFIARAIMRKNKIDNVRNGNK